MLRIDRSSLNSGSFVFSALLPNHKDAGVVMKFCIRCHPLKKSLDVFAQKLWTVIRFNECRNPHLARLLLSASTIMQHQQQCLSYNRSQSTRRTFVLVISSLNLWKASPYSGPHKNASPFLNRRRKGSATCRELTSPSIGQVVQKTSLQTHFAVVWRSQQPRSSPH